MLECHRELFRLPFDQKRANGSRGHGFREGHGSHYGGGGGPPPPLKGVGVDRIVMGPESLVSSVVPPAPQPAATRSKRNQTKERLMAMVYPNFEADATGKKSAALRGVRLSHRALATCRERSASAAAAAATPSMSFCVLSIRDPSDQQDT